MVWLTFQMKCRFLSSSVFSWLLSVLRVWLSTILFCCKKWNFLLLFFFLFSKFCSISSVVVRWKNGERRSRGPTMICLRTERNGHPFWRCLWHAYHCLCMLIVADNNRRKEHLTTYNLSDVLRWLYSFHALDQTMIVQSASLLLNQRNQPSRECLYAWYPEVVPDTTTTVTMAPRDIYLHRGLDKDLLQQSPQANGCKFTVHGGARQRHTASGKA